jgi:O-antigen/teichoic acid export membrane protein
MDRSASMRPTILRSAIYGYGAGLVLFLTALVSNIVISRVMGPEALGEYFFVVTVNVMATSFASLGIGLANSTFLARREHSPGEMNFVSLVFALVLGIFCIVIFQALRHCLPGIMEAPNLRYLDIAIFLLPLSIYGRYWNSMMVGLDRIASLSKVLSLMAILWNLLLVIAVYLGGGVKGLLSAWGAYVVCSALIMAVITFVEQGRPRYAPAILKKAFLFGFQGNLGEIATELWKKLDVFLVYHFCGMQNVGFYSIALTIVEKFSQVTAPVRIAITPRVSGEDAGKSSRITEKACRQILFFTAMLSLVIFVAADPLIRLFYGQNFAPVIAPLRVLLAGIVISSIASVLSIFFIGQLKRPGLLSLLAWINVCLNCVLCTIFIPLWGLVGAAVSTSLTCILGTLIFVFLYRRITGNSASSLMLIRRSDLEEMWQIVHRIRKGA